VFLCSPPVAKKKEGREPFGARPSRMPSIWADSRVRAPCRSPGSGRKGGSACSNRSRGADTRQPPRPLRPSTCATECAPRPSWWRNIGGSHGAVKRHYGNCAKRGKSSELLGIALGSTWWSRPPRSWRSQRSSTRSVRRGVGPS
jgi:hypothetical protein